MPWKTYVFAIAEVDEPRLTVNLAESAFLITAGTTSHSSERFLGNSGI